MQYTAALSYSSSAEPELIDAETLTAYMLDADFSIRQTSDLLHVHQNTVKYRLKILENRLGYHPDTMPDNIHLFYALALRRLLNS